MSRIRVLAMFPFVPALAALALVTVPQAADAGPVTVTEPVNVTHDLFADNEAVHARQAPANRLRSVVRARASFSPTEHRRPLANQQTDSGSSARRLPGDHGR